MTIQLTKATYVSGVLAAAGSQHTLDAETEAYLVHIGAATWVDAAYTQGRFEDAKIEYDSDGVAVGIVGRANEVVGPVWATDDAGNVTGLVGPDGTISSANVAIAKASAAGAYTGLTNPFIGLQPRNPFLSAEIVPFGTTAINEGATSGGSVSLAVDTTVLFKGKPTTAVTVTGSPSGNTLEVGVSTAAVSLDVEAQYLSTRGFLAAVKADALGPTGIASVRVFCGDSSYSNYWDLVATQSAVDVDGWRIFLAHPSESGVLTTTGTPSATGSKRVKLRIVCSGGTVQTGVYNIALAATAPAQKGRLILTCDDAYDDWHSYLLPALLERNLPASLSVDYVYADSAGFMTSSQLSYWAQHESDLFEFTNHGGNNEAFSGVGLAAYLARVDACDAYLSSVGARAESRRLHAYVQGSYDATLIAALQSRGYTSARAVGASTGQFRKPLLASVDSGTSQMYEIPVAANLQNGVSVATIKGYIDAAIAAGNTVFLMGHKFEAAAGVVTYINGYDASHGMSNLLDYIAMRRDTGSLDVLRWSDWVKGITTNGRSV